MRHKDHSLKESSSLIEDSRGENIIWDQKNEEEQLWSYLSYNSEEAISARWQL